MAKETKKRDFTNSYISIEEMKIYEYKKDEILVHDLTKLFEEYLPTEDSRANFSITTSTEVFGEEE